MRRWKVELFDQNGAPIISADVWALDWRDAADAAVLRWRQIAETSGNSGQLRRMADATRLHVVAEP